MVLCLAMGAGAMAQSAGGGGEWPPPTGVVRGAVNIVSSPGEIVRDISYYGGVGYEAAGEPGAFFCGVGGAVPGVVMCALRIADGVLDCFTLGIWGNAVTHSEEARDFFPDFFWQDVWLPEGLSR